MDTLGAKRMSLYGYHRETTPSLELLAKDCTVYNRCFAPACWTIPSHASMFTGLYPSQHATHEANPILSKNIRHLATVLKMSGYRTYGLSSNGLVAPASGLCPDFDYFVDFGESFDEWMENFSQKMPDNGVGLSSMLADIPSSIEKIKLSIKYLMKTGKSDEFIKEGIRFFNRRLQDATTIDNSSYFSRKTVKIFHKIIESSVVTDDKPFFIFINLMEAHEHYRPPLKWRKYSRWWDRQPFNIGSFYNPNYQKYLSKLPIFRNLYDDEICFLDHIVHNIYNICNNNKLLD